MYRIVRKEALKPTVILYEIEAPMVAKKAEPGQFIILRVDEMGERIPITIHDYDREKGTVTIIVQTVGATTEKLSHKQQGDCLQDFVGPLGKPTETEGKKKVCVVGGGVGCAIAYPVLKKFHDCGAEVHAVVGFKSKDVVPRRLLRAEGLHRRRLLRPEGYGHGGAEGAAGRGQRVRRDLRHRPHGHDEVRLQDHRPL